MLEAYRVPIDPTDVLLVAEALRAADVFTPTFNAPEVDLYNPIVYLQQEHRFDTGTTLLLDRNVLTRIAAVSRGVPATSEHRLAAAIVAFAQCANIDLEPNIALYELAFHDGQTAASEELALFRRSDEAHPGYWAEVALGRAATLGELPELRSRASDAAVDFTMPLRRWRRNYVLCLKIAELALAPGNARERLRRFVRWSYNEFILGGPAIALAAHYLAPNASRGGLLKQLRSPDRERALRGIQNAAWDLTLVSEWLLSVEHQEERARLVLLTSFDNAVHRLARSVADVERQDGPHALARALGFLWGEEVGPKLSEYIEDLYASRDAPERRINTEVAAGTVDDSIAEGEAAIRAWTPLPGDG